MCFYFSSFLAAQTKENEKKNDKTTEKIEKKDEKKDEKEKMPKKEPIRWGLRSIGISNDLSPYLVSFFDGDLQRYELGLEANISNIFFLQAEGGYSSAAFWWAERTPFRYVNTGTYYRFGIDYNFLHRSLDLQSLFLGARYGMANFEHLLYIPTSGNGALPDESVGYWEGFNNIKETGLTRQWFELTGGLTSNIYRRFYASVIFRCQFDLGGKDGETVKASNVPGLRRTDKSPNIVLNYKIIYRLPLGKK
jgi:hypothetical protein